MPIVSNFNITEKTQLKYSARSYLPQQAIVPFMQEEGCRCRALVKVGDTVSEGQIIASPLSIIQNGYSANIHAPLPGIVQEIRSVSLPDGKCADAAVIAVKGSFSFLGKKNFPAEWSLFSPESLQNMIAEKGIVNTFSKPNSLASEISRIKSAKKFVVLRLFDDDPSRQTDSFVASHYPAQVAEGTAIIATALRSEGIILVTSKKAGSVITTEIASRFFERFPHLCVSADTAKYPCGFKQDLVRLIKKSQKGTDSVFENISHKELFIDPETAFAVYEAVVCGIPMTSCFVHVTGDCLGVSGVLRVSIGTTMGFLASQCGRFLHKVSKIVVNGLYVGTIAPGFDVPITKMVKSVTFLPVFELVDPHYASCVRCGGCRRVCPENLYPDLLYSRLNGMDKQIKKEILETSLLCSSCALCNSVCPSRLPLSQSIALLKKELKYE